MFFIPGDLLEPNEASHWIARDEISERMLECFVYVKSEFRLDDLYYAPRKGGCCKNNSGEKESLTETSAILLDCLRRG